MTRINAGIKPSDLCRQHLIAEHREIKRVPNSINSGKAVVKNLPKTFRLGPGHVKFFYDKLGYLKDRYIQIRNECYDRGYKVTDYVEAWDNIPAHLMGDWVPTDEARSLVAQRILERMPS